MIEHTLVLNSDWAPYSIYPLSTVDWQRSICGVLLGHLRPVHFYDNWIIHSPTTSFRVPAVAATTKKYVHIKHEVSHRYSTAFLRDNYTCQYCGARPNKLTADHVLPRSKKGTSNLDNISTACSECNHSKGNDERIRPQKLPHVPTYYELASRYREQPITIPHASWIEYIGWKQQLVKIREPTGMPGYI